MDEAVLAAAKAMFGRYHADEWEEASEQVRAEYLEAARDALLAAAPYLEGK